MNVADPRTRSKVVLEGTAGPTRRTDFTFIAISNITFLLAIALAKTSLADAAVPWTVVKILGLGAVGGFVWGAYRGQQWALKTVEWPVVGLASLLLAVRVAALLFALVRLPAIRFIIFAQFSSVWMNAILNNVTRPHALLVLVGISLSFLSDASFSYENFRHTAPAYMLLGLDALSSSLLEHTQGVLLPALGPAMTTSLTISGASLLSTTIYMCSRVLRSSKPADESHTPSIGLSAAFLLAIAIFYTAPMASKRISYACSPREATLSYLVVIGSAVVLKGVRLLPMISGTDVAVSACLCYGIGMNKSRETLSQSPYGSISILARSYLKSILSNPESRKIFYFLVLNMCYMLVQMLYGIWTNSLGLISDAIHMAFDCMAIGVGLIASVMARWAPNERFTYGYGRIETLSGFSNGVFLILISIFIVFEAIERLMNPPEMNTSQLLLVSTLGLGVNLFGMFAMGGHHHHGGHSHSHGHSHGHDAAPPKVTSPSASHSHDHGHDHGHGHSHLGGSPQSARSVEVTHGHGHSHDQGSHGHSHAHDDANSQLRVNTGPLPSLHLSHSDCRVTMHDHHCDHEHEHEHEHGHEHQHEHGHSAHGHHHEASRLLPSPPLDMKSPITPSYHFDHDAHYEHHHASGHGPNLHDHSHIHDQAHEGHSHNMRGVFLHVLADTLGSVGVIISTLLIQFYGWTGFDPIASLFIAILIAASVIPLVIDTGKVLMLDLSHRTSSVERALTELHQVDGVASYSSPRFWPKDDSNIIGSIRISVAPSASSHDPSGPHSTIQGRYQQVDRVVERVDTLLRSRISGLEELTIQVEPVQ